MESQEKQKIIIIGDASLKRERELFLMGTKTNTTSQTLSVIQELMQQDGVEVEVVDSETYQKEDLEVPIVNTEVNQSITDLISTMNLLEYQSYSDLPTKDNTNCSKCKSFLEFMEAYKEKGHEHSKWWCCTMLAVRRRRWGGTMSYSESS